MQDIHYIRKQLDGFRSLPKSIVCSRFQSFPKLLPEAIASLAAGDRLQTASGSDSIVCSRFETAFACKLLAEAIGVASGRFKSLNA
jgi:hypothetical protein